MPQIKAPPFKSSSLSALDASTSSTSSAIGVIEDDPEFAAQLTLDLTQYGHQIKHFNTGEDFLSELQQHQFDLCLFDLNLPGINGLEVLTKLKRQDYPPPVVFITSNDSEDVIAHILLSGADDYIVKPYHPHVLHARIQALLRRTQPKETENTEQLGHLTIDHIGQTIALRGERVSLTGKERIIIFALLKRRGQIVSRQMLNTTMGNDDLAVDTRRLDVHISRIRSKLELNMSNGWKLTSIYQLGYRLDYIEVNKP